MEQLNGLPVVVTQDAPTIYVLPDELRDRLKAPLPEEAVTEHTAKKYLSNIKPIYVVERLNDVFGIGGWTMTDEIIKETEHWVVVKGSLKILNCNITIVSYGGNNNEDLGDRYKGALTDALTKAASYLEVGIDVHKGKQKPTGKKEQAGKQTYKPSSSSKPKTVVRKPVEFEPNGYPKDGTKVPIEKSDGSVVEYWFNASYQGKPTTPKFTNVETRLKCAEGTEGFTKILKALHQQEDFVDPNEIPDFNSKEASDE